MKIASFNFSRISGLVCFVVFGVAISAAAFQKNGTHGEVAKVTKHPALIDRVGAIELTNSPVGAIIAYAGDWPPPSIRDEAGNVLERLDESELAWQSCEGQWLEVKKHPELFLAIGFQYGKNEKGEMRLPDYRGLFLRSVDKGSGRDPDHDKRTALDGKVAGSIVGSFQSHQVGPHTHSLRQAPHSHTIDVRDGDGGNDRVADGEGRHDGNPSTSAVSIDIEVLSNGTTETRPSNVAVLYLIKTRNNPSP